MKSALLLLSGGLDSAANLVLGADAGFQVKLAVTFNYGQRSAKRELAIAARLAESFGIEHRVVDLSHFPLWLGQGGGSLLNVGSNVPHPTDLDDLAITRETAKSVWVPNRNGVFIAIASAVAEANGLDAVALGFNIEEAATFPDNTEAYMEAETQGLAFSTRNQIKILSATSKLNKQQIVQKLMAKGFDFKTLWSCYEAGAQHCGECESCQRLKRALHASEISLCF